MKSSYSHNDYSIAWICALPLEMAAAKAMLDETHPSLPQSSNDHNVYTLGSISGHAVVISCLPYGVYGTTSAATVLAEMRATFPSLQFALMVGIGGGVPSGSADVRLGDVVVSKPTAAFGGVVQYDYGKATNNARFERAGTLNKPPVILLNAMAQIESDHLLEGETITNIVADVLAEKEEIRKKFSRPKHDWLFKPTYPHENYEGTNTECLECNQNQLVRRAPRPNNDVRTHYGLIASGNGVMKDAERRDLIAQELDILCFEMEAAGLMDQLPCLVIRGICDYCDSHKHKKWQGYASLTAAAYAKHLLSVVPSSSRPAQVESENQSWMVPFQRNPKFTGRGDIIKKLEDFVSKRDGPKKFSLVGLGGMGKTQVALELAYRVRDKDPDCSVFWISAVSDSSIEQAYMSIAQELELKNVDPANVKSRVKSHLGRREMGKWLIIYDNADDTDMWFYEDDTDTELKGLIPYSDQGRVLFTTRNRQLAQRLAPSHYDSITEMDEETATEVLRKSLYQKDLLDDPDITTALLKQLTFLPLAITQAATYINNTGIQLPDYLELLQEQEQDVVELLSENFEDEGRHSETQNPVAMTWLISFHHIQRRDLLAIEYLSYMACINPRNIPRSLLPPASSLKRQTDALGLLSAYSFITTQQDHSFSLHRLVHLATRNWLRQNDLLGAWARKAADQLNEIFPDSQYTNRPLWRLYMPHALFLFKESEYQTGRKRYSSLLQRVGRCLHKDGRYNEAEGLLRAVVDIQEAKHGKASVLTLVAMGHLASTYRKQGRWKEAEKLELEILNTSKKELGPEHRNTLDSMHHLTLIYSKQRRWKEAEDLEMKVVEISMRVLGQEHPDTLNSLFNLASLYWEQGRLDEAEELEARLLELSRKVIGVDHPDTLMNMHNLAFTWYDMGRYEEALKMMEDCIQLRIDTLGPEHSDTKAAIQALKGWREKEPDPSRRKHRARQSRESTPEKTPALRKTRTHKSADSKTSSQSSRQRKLQINMFSSFRPRSTAILKHQLRGTPSVSTRAIPSAAQVTRLFSTTTPVRAPESTNQNPTILLQDKESGFGFARSNPRPKKPRTKGVTEIRGPYYSVMGKRYLADVLETMGAHVDGLKFAGGSFSLFPEKQLRELTDLAHEHGVYVSTGGWAEHLLTHADTESVFEKYLLKCKDLGFDVVELSSGFLSFPADDWLRLIDKVHSHKLIAKPELGIQFGAGGDTSAGELEALGTSDPGKLINLGQKFLNAGVERLMIESEGITENVKTWRTDVVSKIMKELPMEKVMFEAADPKVYNWYIREFGVDVNVFVDHSQIVQLECLRRGIWGMADTFGKVVSYRSASTE